MLILYSFFIRIFVATKSGIPDFYMGDKENGFYLKFYRF